MGADRWLAVSLPTQPQQFNGAAWLVWVLLIGVFVAAIKGKA